MCGIFGILSSSGIDKSKLNTLVKHSKQRGTDSSGLLYYDEVKYNVDRADYDVERLLNKIRPFRSRIVLGHSRLITNGLCDNHVLAP